MANTSGVKRFIKNLVMENVHRHERDHYASSFHLNFLCTDRSLSVLHRILVAFTFTQYIFFVGH